MSELEDKQNNFNETMITMQGAAAAGAHEAVVRAPPDTARP